MCKLQNSVSLTNCRRSSYVCNFKYCNCAIGDVQPDILIPSGLKFKSPPIAKSSEEVQCVPAYYSRSSAYSFISSRYQRASPAVTRANRAEVRRAIANRKATADGEKQKIFAAIEYVKRVLMPDAV